MMFFGCVETFNFFALGFDKESAILTLLQRDISNGNRLVCLPFSSLSGRFAHLLTVHTGTLINIASD